MTGVLILATFFVFAALMFSRVLPAMLALPLMAVVIVLLPGGNFLESVTTLFTEGVIRLAEAMVFIIFGAILAHVVYSSGIAESIVKRAAELAGDRPMVVALVLAVATFVCATSLEGLGAVIMIGTIVLPILMSVGIPALSASSMFLSAYGMGVILNVAIWGYFSDVAGVSVEQIQTFAFVAWPPLAVATLIFIVVNTRQGALQTTWAMPLDAEAGSGETGRSVPIYAMITPLVPVAILLLSRYGVLPTGSEEATTFNINIALLLGALYGCLTTRPREIVNTMTASVTEGIKSVAPVIGLLIGIGMLLIALTSGPVQDALGPVLTAVVPDSRIGYVAFFALLAPLAIYRGPLNLFGLGAGVVALLSGLLAPAVVIGALMAISNVQAVSDPTNTHNAWASQFTQLDPQLILRKTLPYVWAAAAVAILVIGIYFWTPA